MTPELAADYWSVPEILIEMRCLAQRINQIEVGEDLECFRQLGGMNNTYDRLKKNFHCVVATLGYRFSQYYKSDTVLTYAYQNKKQFLEFWKNWRYRMQWNHKLDNKRLPIRLRKMIFDFLLLPEVKEVLAFIEAKESASALAALEGGVKIYDDQMHAMAIELYDNFVVNARKFFKEYLHEEATVRARKQLYEVASWAKQVLIAHEQSQQKDVSRVDRWGVEYREAVWHDLQQIADCICGLFRSSFETKQESLHLTGVHYIRAYTAFDMVNQIQKEVDNISATKKPGTTKKGRQYLDRLVGVERCIALLITDNDTAKIAAFSGYHDISSKQSLYNSLNINYCFLGTFKVLCEALNWCALEVTDQIANHMNYIAPDGTEKTLWEKIIQPPTDYGFKRNYSCSERKLLGYLDVKKDFPNSMVVYVNKEPCDMCKPVINLWWKNHPSVVAVKVDYIKDDNSPDWQPSKA